MPRVGIDTGGTFTDAVVPVRGGGWRVHKRPTTPEKPSDAILSALEALASRETAGTELVHGTTHATNALLTGKLGRVVFVTTKGFRDVLAIGRQERPELYALEPRPMRPAQPAARIVEVNERIDAAGKAVQPLGDAEVRRVVAAVRKLKPAAVAVGLLHSYRAPAHERKLARALKSLGVPVIASADVAPEYREYERFTTTWADAALHPVVAPALMSLATALKQGWGRTAELHIVRSDGGTCSARAAASRPVSLALSGPAGGLAAARSLADARGDAGVLTLDMGGTSTDVALVGAGELPLQPLELGGLPLLTRGLPVHSVGTGGGSVASWDRGGALVVGPESAGAEPGPACYGRGGTRPTVTDAHLVAGRLHAAHFLGGEFDLDAPAAQSAIEALRRQGGLRTAECADAVLTVATAQMERALRRVSLAEGFDPATLALYSFGGAGGLHACWLAERLGMPRVVVPPHPGAFSALGFLSAPARRTLARTVLRPLPDKAARAKLFAALEKQAVRELKREGVPESRIRVRRTLELRGAGQAGEFALPEGARAAERFHSEHERRFGYARRDEPVVLVAVRVQADGVRKQSWKPSARTSAKPKPVDSAMVRFPEIGKRLKANWFRRETLRHGMRVMGPAVVAEYSGTTVIPPGWVARVDKFEALVLEADA